MVSELRQRSFGAFPAEAPLDPAIEYEFTEGNSTGFRLAFTSEKGWRLRAIVRRAKTISGIAPAGLWPEPLVPKAAIAHRLARALLPAARWCVGTRAGRSALLSGAVAHPRRVPAGAAQQLVGAYALAAYGSPRATGDIDLWVRTTETNAGRVMEALRRFGAPVETTASTRARAGSSCTSANATRDPWAANWATNSISVESIQLSMSSLPMNLEGPRGANASVIVHSTTLEGG